MALNIQSLRYVSDGVTATYALTGIDAPTELNILVIVNGLVQLPTTDYYIFEGGIIFNNIPFIGSDIELRHYNVGTSGFQGSLGDKGPTGETGFQGSGGIIGPAGFQGSVGNSIVASEYGVELIFSSTEPALATANTMWWNTNSNTLSVYEANQWVAVSSAAGSGYAGSVGFVGSTGTGFTGSRGIGFAGSIGAFAPRASQILTADGGNLYTLDESVASTTQIFVIVNGLVQIPTTDYTVSGTSLTFVSNTPIIGSDIEVRYFGASQGEFGYDGSVGYKGSVGYSGSTGFRGSAGVEGSQGPQGDPGGDRGYTGSKGTNGTNGSTGFDGSRGVQGEQGVAGAPKHVEYFVGDGIETQFQSIYSIETAKRIFVMVNGLVQMPEVDYIISPTNVLEFISTTPGINADIEIRHFDFVGYAGSVGYLGSAGYKGSAGNIGITGFSGSVGDRGLPGGDQGYTGSRGTNGDTGFVGSKGFAGSQGFAGAPKANQTYIADGVTSQFSLNRSVESTKSIFVMVNGLVLIPDSDYSISGFFTLILNDIPNNLSDIEIRYFDETGYSGSTGTTGFRGSVGYSGSNGYAEVFMGPNAPPNPEDGTLWWDTDNGILNIYYEDEETWVGIAEGPRGPRGYAGSLGYTGSRGFTGSFGYTGSQGISGFTGSFGYTGSIGYTGSQGIAGAFAALGYTGSFGFTGSLGIGYAGSFGYTGSQGIAGEFAALGYTGSIGYSGSIGYTGSIGYAGSQGIAGAFAALGYTGSIGYSGSLGIGYAGSQGIVGYVGSAGTGGGASLGTRATFTGTTSSLAAGASASLNIQAYKGYAIYKIQVDGPSWVRVYSNGNSRSADASRLVTAEPNYNTGVIAEIVTTTAKTISFTPATIGFNDESSVSNIIPLAVSNDSSGSRAVTVTLTLIQLESE